MRPQLLAIGLACLAGGVGLAVWASGGSGGEAPQRTATGPMAGAFRPPTQSDPVARFLSAPAGSGHLAPGSDPSVLPGPILIADEGNNRLLIVDPQGRVRWQFPRPGDLAPGQTFRVPDDTFFSADGRYIIATEEEDSVISLIDIASRRIVYRYGVPGQPGMLPNHLDNPDDAIRLPDGSLMTADIKNCRLLLIRPGGHAPLHIFGQSTNSCLHDPPLRFGSPNGAFPMTNGHYLVTEINGDWVDELSLDGTVAWSTHPPAVAYPSDANEISPGRYLTVDYSSPGQVVIFNRAGETLWRYAPTTAGAELNHPSLAVPLPNGDILLNDDYNNRVIVIDSHTNQTVWQYGHTGLAGNTPGYLNNPDGLDPLPPNSLLVTHAKTMGTPPG
jgi:putative pyrroloquinoline-quinone binding quinoprotein